MVDPATTTVIVEQGGSGWEIAAAVGTLLAAAATVAAVLAALRVAKDDRQAAELRAVADRKAADDRAAEDRHAAADLASRTSSDERRRWRAERKSQRAQALAMFQLDLLVRLADAYESMDGTATNLGKVRALLVALPSGRCPYMRSIYYPPGPDPDPGLSARIAELKQQYGADEVKMARGELAEEIAEAQTAINLLAVQEFMSGG